MVSISEEMLTKFIEVYEFVFCHSARSFNNWASFLVPLPMIIDPFPFYDENIESLIVIIQKGRAFFPTLPLLVLLTDLDLNAFISSSSSSSELNSCFNLESALPSFIVSFFFSFLLLPCCS